MNPAPANLLLATVPTQQKELLTQLLEPVALPTGKVLYSPDRPPAYIHFLTSGVASISTYLAGGESSEVGWWVLKGRPRAYTFWVLGLC